MASKAPAKNPVLKPRFRIVSGTTVALGPGKVKLLESLIETGSLNETARQLEMSYMRAWTLIKIMNRHFRQPLIVAARGGKAGGGMQVTPAGRRVLTLYRKIESTALRSTAAEWRGLQKLIKHSI
jgi:molybdate transport system regulatory protein